MTGFSFEVEMDALGILPGLFWQNMLPLEASAQKEPGCHGLTCGITSGPLVLTSISSIGGYTRGGKWGGAESERVIATKWPFSHSEFMFRHSPS